MRWTFELDPDAATAVEVSEQVYFTRNRLAVKFEQETGTAVVPLDHDEAVELFGALAEALIR